MADGPAPKPGVDTWAPSATGGLSKNLRVEVSGLTTFGAAMVQEQGVTAQNVAQGPGAVTAAPYFGAGGLPEGRFFAAHYSLVQDAAQKFQTDVQDGYQALAMGSQSVANAYKNTDAMAAATVEDIYNTFNPGQYTYSLQDSKRVDPLTKGEKDDLPPKPLPSDPGQPSTPMGEHSGQPTTPPPVDPAASNQRVVGNNDHVAGNAYTIPDDRGFVRGLPPQYRSGVGPSSLPPVPPPA
jgi:hypothetical protein